jgi:hypothetical protein
MLNGELLHFLDAAKYLNAQIAVRGGDVLATPGDLIATGLSSASPVTLSKLLEYVEDKIKEIYFEIKRLVGKAHWDLIIEAYDDTLTEYKSRSYERGPVPK